MRGMQNRSFVSTYSCFENKQYNEINLPWTFKYKYSACRYQYQHQNSYITCFNTSQFDVDMKQSI